MYVLWMYACTYMTYAYIHWHVCAHKSTEFLDFGATFSTGIHVSNFFVFFILEVRQPAPPHQNWVFRRSTRTLTALSFPMSGCWKINTSCWNLHKSKSPIKYSRWDTSKPFFLIFWKWIINKMRISGHKSQIPQFSTD